MKDYRFITIVGLCVLVLSICFCTDTYGVNPQFGKGRKVYGNGFIYIMVDPEYNRAEIYEVDSNPFHPVLPRTFKRGSFHLEPIKGDFYSIVNGDLPGEKCIDNMEVSCTPCDSEHIHVGFKLGHSKDSYLIMAESIRTNTIYTLAYPSEEVLSLPKDTCGYRFSIIPAAIYKTSLAGIAYGFSPTLKYLNLRNIENDVFSSGGAVEISLPLFEDEIFDLWCINGEIMQINNKILNDKIIWHGKEFTLFERIPAIFKF